MCIFDRMLRNAACVAMETIWSRVVERSDLFRRL